jgi:tagatose-1,6-bisphosphate aldolase
MCAALEAHASAAASQLPALVAAAALALHSAADALLLRDAFCHADARAAGALRVLSALHAGFEAGGVDDGLLRGGVAVRLALLLAEEGQLPEARVVIKQVRCLF